MQKLLTVCYQDQSLREAAVELASRLDLPLNDAKAPLQLMVTTERLQLQSNAFAPIYADFSWPVLQKRRQEGKKQGIVRACKPAVGLKILDVTAGWGRDAGILASFGAQVTLLERNPIMAALLEDALNRRDERARKNSELRLIHEDALNYLQHLSQNEFPDVIYMDPMHPTRQKSALVKKDLQILQRLIGTDADALELLQLARQRARQRVVVKWPEREPPLFPADFTIAGKTVRFDCYQTLSGNTVS